MTDITNPIRPDLHFVENDTERKAYCGPTAIAAVSGQPISRVLDACRTVRNGNNWADECKDVPPVRGISRWVLERALRLLGYAGYWVEDAERPTLAAWLNNRTSVQHQHPCIVNVTRHFVAVAGYQFVDTFTKGQVVEIDEAPHRRKRVERVFVVTRRVPPGPVTTKSPSRIAAEIRKRRRGNSRGYREFVKYARSVGATWQKERGADFLDIQLADGRSLTVTHSLLPDDWFGAAYQLEDFLSSPTPDPRLFSGDGRGAWCATTV